VRVVGFIGVCQHAVGKGRLEWAAHDIAAGDGCHCFTRVRARELDGHTARR
jgi:hypothetical protein